jgi:hypothetical protein
MASTIGGPPGEAVHIDVFRDEIKILKDEQRDRIRARDSLIYSVIVAVAAVAGATRLAGPAVPLLLPPITLALGWTYLVNDHAVTAIGRYLRTDLAPRLAAATGTEVLRWETSHRTDRRRRQRKLIQLAVDLLVFIVPAAVALVWYWTHDPAGPTLLTASAVEAVAVTVATWQIIAYAETAAHKKP